MYTYPANDPVLQGLFDENVPNSPALWAVLKGNHTGKAVVDKQHRPSQCVLRTDAALTYFCAQTSQEFLEEAIQRFRKVGLVWLIWPQTTSLDPPDEFVEVVERLEFYEYDPVSDKLDQLKKQLPIGYEIQTIDAENLQRCKWREEMEFYFDPLI